MRCFALFNICILMAAAVFLNAACNNQEKEREQQDKEQITTKPPDKTDPVLTKPELPTPEQLAERAKTAEHVKKTFEANYRIEKTATGYSLGGLKFNEFGEPVASGIYFYMIKAGEFTATRKMLIRK